MKPKADLLIHNAKKVIIFMSDESDPLERIANSTLVIRNDTIMAVGNCPIERKLYSYGWICQYRK